MNIAQTTTKYQTYPKYKPSGIDWLGDIPEEWDVKRLKYVTSFRYGNSLPEEKRNIDGEIEVYGSNGFIGYHDEAITKKPTIVIGRKGSYGKLAWVDNSCFPVDTTYFIDSGTTQNDLRWIYYVLSCLRLNEGNQDSAVPGLSRESAYSIIVSLPPLPEQRAIADFLNRETEKIDEVVAKKQELIELLLEKRQAIISQAVTKGLSSFAKASADKNPKAKMKNSGIPWLSEIPESWTIKRLRFVCKTNTPKSEYKGDKNIEITFLAMESIGEDGELNTEDIRKLEEVYGGYTYFTDGDILVAKITPCFENGKGAYVHGLTNGMGFGSTEFHVLRANKLILPEYLYLITYSHPFRKIGGALMEGAAGQKRVPEDFIKNFTIGIPSIEEQINILNEIKSKSEIIQTLVNKIKLQNQKLQEFRQALISNVVTGKVKVIS